MKAYHQSIRWRLQLWHSVILLAVLAAFGVTTYWLMRDILYKRVDAELQRRMTVVTEGLRPRPRAAIAAARPGPGFRLSPEQQKLFEPNQPESFYYVVWSDKAIEHASATAPPGVPIPDRNALLREATLRQRGEFRELAVVSPTRRPPGPYTAPAAGARWIAVVGCSVTDTQDEIRRLVWWFAGVGGGVLIFGVMTGWFLSARSIRPIRSISAAAKTIAGGNLSERISLDDTESELGELAGVLNETFARLEAAFARQAQFTADASHELRTPTFVILSQAQSALKRERTAAEYREGFEVCQRAAQQIRQLIESLLTLTREDAGESALHREPVRLDEIARDGVDLLRSLAADRKVTLHLALNAVHVSGGAQPLRQVVVNLVSNAIEYNRPGGNVTVAVAQESDSALLTVRDDGPGIAEENLPHVFERFYRVDKSRSSAEGHTGLGLAICKAIIKSHGGTIEASSRVNEGAVFTLRLPAVPAAPRDPDLAQR